MQGATFAEVYGNQHERPDNRIIINNEYNGIAFEEDGSGRHIPVRQFLEAIGATVSWNPENLVKVDYGEKSHFPDFFIKDNKAYVKEEFLSDELGLSLQYNEEINAIAVFSQTDYKSDIVHAIPRYNGYSEEDLKWLSQIIHAEANGEPYEAKLAVGNVILNRVESLMYPDRIKDVIFDKNCGVQFTPTVNGSIYNTPSTSSFLAAVEVLEGKRNADGVLFFINPRYAKSSWVSRNRTFAFTMNNHDFYY